MHEINDVGIVGAAQGSAELATLAGAAGYRVFRIDPGFATGDVRSVNELQQRLDALCLCVSEPSEVYRVVAEYLRLGLELRPTYLLNMTTIGPGHARRIDSLLNRLAPKAIFAECQWTGSVRTLCRREAVILYGSRSGSPGGALERLLAVFATRVLDLGNIATASAGKLLSNAAAVSIALSTVEAIELGRESGLSTHDIFEILSSGMSDSRILRECLVPALFDGELQEIPQLNLAKQDVRLALALAGAKGLQANFASLALRSLDNLTVEPHSTVMAADQDSRASVVATQNGLS
jgi:3-hydroxyisobutyrate dehydrogenase-like beta-hydroxyacid dehydrogenase